jgi:N-acetylneuraminic acid mutarotase
VAGGCGSDNQPLASAELYDPATGTWSSTGSLAVPRYYHTATLLPNGKVLVAAGYGGSGSKGYLSHCELYDPKTETWLSTNPLGFKRVDHTATLLHDGKVLVAGGNGDSGGLTDVVIYDPEAGSWESTGSMNGDRYYHTATLLHDGKVLVAGGWRNPGALASAETYNPATRTWTETNPLNVARYSQTATLLPNGKVLVAGGHGSGSLILSSCELYDPATRTWSSTAPLPTALGARYRHTAVLLPNGKVLAAGGISGSGWPLSLADLYVTVIPLPFLQLLWGSN